jgi:GAF domain-containing protein
MGIPMVPDESINPTPIDRERRKNLQARGVIESLIHLHAIASSSKLSLNEKIETILELGSAHLKMPIAILGRVSGDHLTVGQVISPDSEPNSGVTFPLEDTYSVLAMGTNKPIGFHNIGQSELKKTLAYQDRRYECYLGVRIDIDTKPYGTLSFVDHTPRDEPFSGADYAFLQLLGTWISSEISRSLSEERFRGAIDSLQEGFALSCRKCAKASIKFKRSKTKHR